MSLPIPIGDQEYRKLIFRAVKVSTLFMVLLLLCHCIHLRTNLKGKSVLWLRCNIIISMSLRKFFCSLCRYCPERQTCSVHWSPAWSWGSAGSRLNWSSATPGNAGRCSARRRGNVRKEDDAVRQPMCHSYLWRLVPDRGGLGLVAGSASLVRFPGTREPSFAPLLPARLSLPTDPETIQIVKNASIFLFVISVFRWNLAPPLPYLLLSLLLSLFIL